MQRAATVTVLTVLLVFVVGCSTRHWSLQTPIVPYGPVTVQLEGWDSEQEPLPSSFSHPTELDADVLARVLSGLSYDTSHFFNKDAKPAPVIAPERAQSLANAMVLGFRAAQPHQRLRFTVQNPTKSLGFLPTVTTSRGVAFMQPEGTLHLAFDLVGEKARSEDDDPYPVWTDPTEGAYSRVSLILPEFMSSHSPQRPLWVTVNLAQLGTVVAEDPVMPEQPRAEDRRVPTATQPAVTPPLPSEKRAKLSDQEVLARLRQLEELHQEGMISDETYAKKRKELLEQ